MALRSVEWTAPRSFTSELPDPKKRVLSDALSAAFAHGIRTYEEFLHAFPIEDIMRALANAPGIRARLFAAVTCTGEMMALEMDAATACRELRAALDARLIHAQDIVDAFEADDRVRFLDSERLWSFLAHSSVWAASAAGDVDSTVRARRFVRGVLEQ